MVFCGLLWLQAAAAFFRQTARRRIAPSSSSSLTAKFRNLEEMLDAYSQEPVLVYFTSLTCGPCKLQTRELAAVRDAQEISFPILQIDTKKWPHVGSRFKIGKLPCLLVLQDKQVLARWEGLTKAEDIVAQIHEATIVAEHDSATL
jgi:thioredoxin-like negative regulator of GroEL